MYNTRQGVLPHQTSSFLSLPFVCRRKNDQSKPYSCCYAFLGYFYAFPTGIGFLSLQPINQRKPISSLSWFLSECLITTEKYVLRGGAGDVIHIWQRQGFMSVTCVTSNSLQERFGTEWSNIQRWAFTGVIASQGLWPHHGVRALQDRGSRNLRNEAGIGSFFCCCGKILSEAA